jgi:hypothetical protein
MLCVAFPIWITQRLEHPPNNVTQFPERGFERLFIVPFIPGEGMLMNMREPRHHFALQAFGCPITFPMHE